ncbi:MAG: hypothetical protein NTW21_12925 [Verrucomicrobia bacterium]|nr:hypothetical protein [Verrucomicrobiota bacterium]
MSATKVLLAAAAGAAPGAGAWAVLDVGIEQTPVMIHHHPLSV